MHTGVSLQQLAAELERQVQTRRDYIAPQGKVRATVVADVPAADRIQIEGLNGDTFGVTPYAHGQLSDVLGIPRRYYDRMEAEAPALLANNVNAWLAKDPAHKRMLRTLDGQVRAVLSPKYRPLDNFDLAGAVLPKLVDLQAQIVSSQLTETRMYIKAILPSLSDQLPAGAWGFGHDRIAEYAGRDGGRVVSAIVISNSEVGAGTLRVEPSVFTTWCTNLAVLKAASMRKYHVGRSFEADDSWEVFRDDTRQADDRAFWLKVRDVVSLAFDREAFRAAVASIREAAADPITSPDALAVVEAAVGRLALPAASTGSILGYLAGGGDLSRWGLSSAITAAGGKVDDYETATAFERAGGEVLALPRQQWADLAGAVRKAA